MILGSLFSQLPTTTFCWLPPDMELALAEMLESLICNALTCRSDISLRFFRLSTQPLMVVFFIPA